MLSRIQSFVLAGALSLAAVTGTTTPAVAAVPDTTTTGGAAGEATPVASLSAGAAAPGPVGLPDSLPLFGAMLAAGVPDGATASLVVRPAPWVHLELGGGYNLISKGVRAGVTLVPFGVGPSASLEAGRFFDGDANGIVRQFAGASFGENAVLERVGYDFVNAHLGLDFGSRRMTFFIHGGMSYIRADVHNVGAALNGVGTTSSQTTVTVNQDPQVRVLTPSAKLGLIFYIW